MAEKEHDFDEDEDLFDFANTGSAVAGEDDLDIAEFLSSIDDSDASAIIDLAESEDARAAERSEAPAPSFAAEHELEAPAPLAATQPVVLRAGPLWKQPGTVLVAGLGAALLLANLLGTWITWQKNRAVVEEIEGARLDLRATVDRARRDIQLETSRIEGLTQPRGVAPIGSTSFRSIEEHLTVGDFAGARRLLYTKLALLDRLPVDQRGEVEAQALFVLAEADRLEAAALSSEVDS